MSARQPFSMVPHGDVLARIADLEGDEISLYLMAYFLMLERGGPITDDMAWLGRRAGISTRRANQIRAKLLDQGKWTVRGDMIGDSAALQIVGKRNRKSAINSSNALARWDRAGQPELDFEENEGSEPPKRQKTANSSNTTASGAPAGEAEMRNGGKNEDKRRKNATKTQLKDVLIPQETAEIRQSTPEIRIPDSRARATPELELDTEHTNESESCEPRANGQDPFPAIMEAAGFAPRKPELIDRARDQVDRWLRDGINAETIIASIQRTMASADDDDPTSSLVRFDRKVRHAHATAAAKPKAGMIAASIAPTPADGPDPRLAQIRKRLREESGARTYDGWLRPCRLTLDPPDRLCVDAPSQFMADWVQTHFHDRIRSLARSFDINSITVRAKPPDAVANGRTAREQRG